MAAYDVIRVRSPDADMIGSVSLLAGVELHRERADLFCLLPIVQPLQVESRLGWAPLEQVTDYLDSLRLGQSQRGSFVISLLSPWDFIPSADRDEPKLGFIEPFGRRATKALAKALDAVGKALRVSATEGIRQPFEQAVAAGVSANLCYALAALARDGEGADISIRWSLTKPEEGQPILRLTREDAQSLMEAASQLSEYQSSPDVTVEGIITNIKEEPSSFDGKTTLEALVEKRLRRITVDFAKDDNVTRDALIDAFKHRKRISVTGELANEKGRLRLDMPRDFEVLPANDTV